MIFLSSSTAVADVEFLEGNNSSDIHKNIVTKNENTPETAQVPVNPAFIKYRESVAVSPTKHHTGHVPPTVDFSYLKNFSSPSTLVSLPAYYDARINNKVTSVKDQGSKETCFIFATLGSLESYLMPGQNYYFSEQNIMNLLQSNQGFDLNPRTQGGFSIETTAFLTRWDGPVNNSDDPWNPSVYTSPTTLPRQKHIQNVLWLPMRKNSTDNQAIKQAIYNYGGVDCSMNYEDRAFNSTTNSYYLSSSGLTNHDITVVGWNDAYSASNFTKIPPGPGAFIVKNSWGTSFGDNGYFYISYYDSAFAMQDISTVFTGESPDDYQHIYLHDPLGEVSFRYSNKGVPLWGASVFTARSNETLKAVSFYVPNPNSLYTINIYNNTSSKPISQSGPVLTQNVIYPSLGYNTVTLSSDVNLTAGNTFSIVIVPTSSPSWQAYSYPEKGYSRNATAIAGESFISDDGKSWKDFTSVVHSGTLCIKAFTNSTATRPFAQFTADPTLSNTLDPSPNPESIIIKKEEHNEEDNTGWRDDYRPTVAVGDAIPMYGSPMYVILMYGGPMYGIPMYSNSMHGSEFYWYGGKPYGPTETLNSKSNAHKTKAHSNKHKQKK